MFLSSVASAAPRDIETVRTPDLIPANIRKNAQNLLLLLEEYYNFLNEQGNPSQEIERISTLKDLDLVPDKYLTQINELIGVSVPNSHVMTKQELYRIIIQYYQTRGSEDSIHLFFKIFFNKSIEIFYPREWLFDLSMGKFSGNFTEAPPEVPEPVEPIAPIEALNTPEEYQELLLIYQVEYAEYLLKLAQYQNYLEKLNAWNQTGPQPIYENTRSHLSDWYKLFDGHFYQNYSYQVKTDTDASEWLADYKRFVHPAGLELFISVALEIFRSNNWNQVINYPEAIADSSNWLTYLTPPWLTTGKDGYFLPKYQPGWFKDSLLRFIFTYLFDMQNDPRLWIVYYNIVTVLNSEISSPKFRDYFVRQQIQNEEKFIETDQTLADGWLNKTIAGCEEEFSRGQGTKLWNIGTFIGQREYALFDYSYYDLASIVDIPNWTQSEFDDSDGNVTNWTGSEYEPV